MRSSPSSSRSEATPSWHRGCVTAGCVQAAEPRLDVHFLRRSPGSFLDVNGRHQQPRRVRLLSLREGADDRACSVKEHRPRHGVDNGEQAGAAPGGPSRLGADRCHGQTAPTGPRLDAARVELAVRARSGGDLPAGARHAARPAFQAVRGNRRRDERARCGCAGARASTQGDRPLRGPRHPARGRSVARLATASRRQSPGNCTPVRGP
jgi:hypothetical protein